MSALVVWRDARRVGRLDTAPNGDVRFTYDASVAAEPQSADRVGFRCPVRAAPYVGADAAAVFENLLPEGGLRDALGQATKHDPSDTVGLLGVVGAECAGALQLWPEDVEPPANAAYDPVTETTLMTAFEGAGGQLRQVRGRASLSGAQPKLVLWRRPPVGATALHMVDHQPEYRLPRDGAPTTVVVKRPGSSFPGVLEAELVGMRLMEAAGVPTASSTPCRVAPTCHESARFDRTMDPDGTVHRVHAEDGCQLTGRVSRQKYAGAGGVTYHDLVAVLRRVGAQPASDREQLLRWAVANAVMGNYDAHAKNLSVLYDPAGTVRLAPAYDVVVTTLFAGLDQTLALAFGGTTHPAALTPQRLRSVAREFDVALPQVTALTVDVLARVREALPSALHSVRALGGDAAVVDRLSVAVTATADAFAARLAL
jgi:serine/threonine-protein kinase HipA